VSAKRQKRERAEIRATQDITEAKNKSKFSLRVKNKKFRQTIATIVTAVIVVALLAAIVLNSPLFYISVPAVSIGSHSYNAVEYNYYFNSVYSPYASYLDASIPLSEQPSWFSENETMEEYFRGQAIDTMTQIAMLGDAAKAEGYVLPTEGDNVPTTASEQISALRRASSQYNSDFDVYLESVYGRNMNAETLETILNNTIYASSFQNELINRQKAILTDEQRDAKYAEIAADYDLTSFYAYKVTALPDMETLAISEATLAVAKEQADSLAATHNGELFGEVVYDIAQPSEKSTYQNREATLHTDVAPSSLPELYGEWLKNAARVEGDTDIFAEADGYTVVLFIDRNKNQYHRSTFRDIVLAVQADENGDYNENAISEAKMAAEQLLASWESGDATEEAFAQAAIENSSDTASASSGGLRENAAMGSYAYELEDWIFDETRKPGDTSVIYVKSNSQYAYHIVYYVSTEEQRYDHALAESIILNDYYTAWQGERSGNYQVTEKFGFNFRQK
jgi:hypothetical protein